MSNFVREKGKSGISEEFSSSGVQEFRSSGVQEFRSSGVRRKLINFSPTPPTLPTSPNHQSPFP
jgi:hypothetical protein